MTLMLSHFDLKIQACFQTLKLDLEQAVVYHSQQPCLKLIGTGEFNLMRFACSLSVKTMISLQNIAT